MPPDDDKKPDNKPDDNKPPRGDEALTDAQIRQAFQYLVQQNRQLTGTIEKLESKLEARAPSRTDDAKPPKDDTPDDEVDIDSLDNRGLVKFIVKEVGGLIKPLQDQISGVGDKADRGTAQLEVRQAADAYEDFFEFKEEIEKEIERNPSLSVDDAYHLARTHNPDKVAALDEAAQKKLDEKKQEDEKDKTPSYGGLMPTSTVGKSADAMDAKDAADAAWEQEMRGFEHMTGPS